MKFIGLINGIMTLTQEPVPTLRIDLATSINRNANTFATTGLTLTPLVGRYLILANIQTDSGLVNGSAEFGVFLNGVGRTATYRQWTATTNILGLITLSSNTIAGPLQLIDYIETTSASDIISVSYRSVNGQTISLGNRTLILVKL